jgi:NTE family protein
MNTMIKAKGAAIEAPERKIRVGLAIQGGGFPAGAFAAGVVKGLVEKGAFERYDVGAFSGTSAGALIATVCWGNTLRGTVKDIPAALDYQWTYLNWPEHLAWLLVSTPSVAERWREVDGLLMKMAMWRAFVEQARTPLFRWIMGRWIQDTIAIDAFNEIFEAEFKGVPRKQRPGLVLGSADVLKGEIKTFREGDLSLSALLASGSLDDCNGMTQIDTAPHAGTYLDGAWGDNPPINELLDYGLDEIWFIQHFPKTIHAHPRTPAQRRERKDELWQNSLVEHEMEFVGVINRWNDLLNAAILDEIRTLQAAGQLPGDSPTDPVLVDHLKEHQGSLPHNVARLFDADNGFAPKGYQRVTMKTIAMNVERELGATIVNAPWVIRNLMDHGYAQACAFADRDFGNEPAEKPAARLPGRWASIPGPFNDYLYGRAPTGNALDLACDVCPKKAARTAMNMLPDAVPGVRQFANQLDRALCGVCWASLASRAVTGQALRVTQRP